MVRVTIYLDVNSFSVTTFLKKESDARKKANPLTANILDKEISEYRTNAAA